MLPGMSPENLARYLVKCPTEFQQALFGSLGLPYKHPSETLGQTIISV